MVPDTRGGTTFGREFMGVVETVGSSVQNLKPGDRVMVPFWPPTVWTPWRAVSAPG